MKITIKQIKSEEVLQRFGNKFFTDEQIKEIINFIVILKRMVLVLFLYHIKLMIQRMKMKMKMRMS